MEFTLEECWVLELALQEFITRNTHMIESNNKLVKAIYTENNKEANDLLQKIVKYHAALPESFIQQLQEEDSDNE